MNMERGKWFWKWKIAVCIGLMASLCAAGYEIRLHGLYGKDNMGILMMKDGQNWGIGEEWAAVFFGGHDHTTVTTLCTILGFGNKGFVVMKESFYEYNVQVQATFNCFGNAKEIGQCNVSVSAVSTAQPPYIPRLNCFERKYTDMKLVGGLDGANSGYVTVKMNGESFNVSTLTGPKGDPSTISHLNFTWIDLVATSCGAESDFADCNYGNLLEYYKCAETNVYLDCSVCEFGHYGINCDSCPCVLENSEGCDNISRVCPCDHQVGTCLCKDGWTGASCGRKIGSESVAEPVIRTTLTIVLTIAGIVIGIALFAVVLKYIHTRHIHAKKKIKPSSPSANIQGGTFGY